MTALASHFLGFTLTYIAFASDGSASHRLYAYNPNQLPVSRSSLNHSPLPPAGSKLSLSELAAVRAGSPAPLKRGTNLHCNEGEEKFSIAAAAAKLRAASTDVPDQSHTSVLRR